MNLIDVNVNTTPYSRSHGKEPRGFGSWAFGIGERDPDVLGPNIFWVHGMLYAAARGRARAEAARRGEHTVWVLS